MFSLPTRLLRRHSTQHCARRLHNLGLWKRIVPAALVQERLFSTTADNRDERRFVSFDDEVHLGMAHVEMHHDWTFVFHWVGLGTGIASYCFTVGACQFIIGGHVNTFIAAYYGNILVHELGHAEAARRFGCPVRCIYITPFGGLCCYNLPLNAWHDAHIALAGPAAGTAHAMVCVLAGHVLDPTVLFGVAFFGFLGNGMNLIPFETIEGMKSDGRVVFDAIVKEMVSDREWLKYGYEFPHNFYAFSENQRFLLRVAWAGLVAINGDVVCRLLGY